MRGNVVELAVAVVIGAAFTKIVDAVVKGVINPVIGALGSKELEGYRSCFQGPCHVNAKGEVDQGIYILWGQVISATVTFLLTAAVVYFLMILPMNHLNEMRRRRQGEAEPTPAEVTELELLTEIRDLLAAQGRTAGALAGEGGEGGGRSASR
ncbi:large conductance mechanosensitive channel protein MscL [Streptomyces capparidis]